MYSSYITYSAADDRERIEWPGRARVALWIAVNVEHYEFVARPNPYRVVWSRVPQPDVFEYGSHDYGNRAGFWRLLEVFDHHKIRGTASLNLAVMDHFPEVRDAMVNRDWALMSHGVYNSSYLFGVSAEEERAFYRDSIERLHRHTGKKLKGMLGPAFSATAETPDLMAEAGLIYQADWFLDDQPFPLNVRSGSLIAMPYGREINDSFLSATGEFVQACKDQFDVLYEEGAEGGRVMCIALHPHITGQPHRVRDLFDALEYILAHKGVWATTADDIADFYLENYYDAALARLRGTMKGQ